VDALGPVDVKCRPGCVEVRTLDQVICRYMPDARHLWMDWASVSPRMSAGSALAAGLAEVLPR
jgi:hypothetical protein